MLKINIITLTILLLGTVSRAAGNEYYIDAVLPCHEKDIDTLELSIAGIKKNVKNLRRIITVSAKPLTQNAEWFDEKLYPFTQYDVALEIFKDPEKAEAYMKEKGNRIGWIYQQLLKMYALFVIPDVSPNVLIVDNDTIFFKPVKFIDAKGRALYAVGTEYHKPYFDHGARLIPGFKKVFPKHSGIVHHNFFQRPIMQDMFDIIEKVHDITPWKAMCRCIDKNDIFACIAEPELYFNFIFARPYPVKIRSLKWKNAFSLAEIKTAKKEGYDYISCHAYYRN